MATSPNCKLVWKLDAILIDIDTAFLYGNLKEEIYMDLLEGMTSFDDKCLLLLKALYGLIQAARQWYKKFTTILKKIGFEGRTADPCLFVKQTTKGIIMISVYVNDNFCMGHKAALEEFIADLKKNGLLVKVTLQMTNYLSFNLAFSEDGSTAWIRQPHLIQKLKEHFGDFVKNLQSYVTPGTLGIHIVQPSTKTDAEIQARMPVIVLWSEHCCFC